MNKPKSTSFIKKVILFIVEGGTDHTILSYSLSKLYGSVFPGKYEVIVHHTRGDLTSRPNTNTKIVLRNFEKHVKAALDKNTFKFALKDVEKIFHIVDLDGVFIPDSCVEFRSGQKKAWYDDKQEKIFTDEPIKIIKRNKTKSAVLRDLIPKEKMFFKTKRKMDIQMIPYRIFYFSCNADHVFHNNANLPEWEKVEKAIKFVIRAKQQPYLFENRILEHSRKPNMWEYEESWEWLEEGTHSLQRRTNLDILVKPLLNSKET